MTNLEIPNLFSVKGKTVLITGGSRGIGLMMASTFVKNGAKVYISSRNAEVCQAVEAELSKVGECIAIPADLSTPEGQEELVTKIKSKETAIDVLINNAGIAVSGGVVDLSLKDFDRVMSVNLRGAFLVSKAVAKFMVDEIENREDRSRLNERAYAIINMSSVNDRVAIADYFSYCVSKGGLQRQQGRH